METREARNRPAMRRSPCLRSWIEAEGGGPGAPGADCAPLFSSASLRVLAEGRGVAAVLKPSGATTEELNGWHDATAIAQPSE